MKSLSAMALAVLCWAGCLAAGEPIAIGETLRIRSKVLGEERLLLVSTPLDYARTSNRYPVLYMTDGAQHLLHVRGTVDFLVRNGLMPEMVIVGITNTDRTRDLTPTATPLAGQQKTGGADRFLEFIEKEAFPAVEAKYRTAPCRVFAGHSYGGTLALHTLVVKPELFRGTIAASPSLDWDKDYPLRSLHAALKARKTFRHTLFVTMGNEEAGAERPTRFDRLRAQLSKTKAEGFEWGAKALPEENHGTVVLPSFYWGLRRVFAGWGPSTTAGAEAFGGTLEAMQRHYRQLFERLGCELAIPEAPVNLMGYRLLAQGKLEEAIATFRYNTTIHPGSANVHDSLGEALEKHGDLAAALACYEKAVALGSAVEHPNLNIYEANRARTSASLKPR